MPAVIAPDQVVPPQLDPGAALAARVLDLLLRVAVGGGRAGGGGVWAGDDGCVGCVGCGGGGWGGLVGAC